MKIRSGFVSNSSSSSFIVAFPNEPVSPNDLKQLLFNGKDKKFKCETGRGTFDSNVDQVCGIIYGEILKGDHGCKSVDDFMGLLRHLNWFVNEDNYEEKNKLCGKYVNYKKGSCSSKCPRIDTCNHARGISYEECKRREVLRDIEEAKTTFEYVDKFVHKTLGYKYYWVDGGCQTAFGAFLNQYHAKVFKNVQYIQIDREC